MIAAALIALAAVVGFTLFSKRLREWRLSGTLIGVHATLAISGFVPRVGRMGGLAAVMSSRPV